MPLEERLYRHRCVEGWAMAVPWTGFPMAALLSRAKPLSAAKIIVMGGDPFGRDVAVENEFFIALGGVERVGRIVPWSREGGGRAKGGCGRHDGRRFQDIAAFEKHSFGRGLALGDFPALPAVINMAFILANLPQQGLRAQSPFCYKGSGID